ncbi:hypothetical protein EPYR_00643 [Erwinia pyrifoliae DSM 12163]|nr:hypothetical protein EJP617_04860 [Erwinia sp. Ejp617]CAY73007.1 hypothetical protein EPYR_00643 [Erwinia pyrifoliae DSM 12163]
MHVFLAIIAILPSVLPLALFFLAWRAKFLKKIPVMQM